MSWAPPAYCGPVPPRGRPAPPPLSQITHDRRRKDARRLNALSLACLRLASPHSSFSDWRYRLELLCRAYSPSAIAERLRQLGEQGYIADGLPETGFLTDKGRVALQEAS